ncbi:isocitrate lyase/phosphoenolpyruvate mutase family protein [Streptomyces armeniacus]|uniref:Isocitrate lyase/phosphoenolpyruvate mutase family protein n=1 Tax=Streptomyces armeniacus TaxID=83291 RepID=A0A345Y012_9ACTN|nr:isocitrate lyase/phosphoenolpyruvate mutase family protein [Streptomyces armeniacus]AXK37228.1 isocitrate lyase/phosphoenolpyruvate mutase family protein [Streptomyces armeniacus]
MTGPPPDPARPPAPASAARLRALHAGRAPGDPLVLPGPWDAASADVFVRAGAEALATPSHGIAASLGHADGSTPADEMFAAVARIVRAVDGRVPVSADIERGYGLPPAELVARLLGTGAVGCNLEDSAGGELVDPRRQADFLSEVHAAAGDRLFVNARIDTYIRGAADPLGEALERGRLYVAAGAECVYPFAAPPADLGVLAGELGVPVNAIPLPDGPSARELAEAGASRITYGGGLHARALAAYEDIARTLPLP